MSQNKRYITNNLMIYSLVVIAISAANIGYSNENPDYPEPPSTTNYTSNNSTKNNTTGYNINDIHQVMDLLSVISS